MKFISGVLRKKSSFRGKAHSLQIFFRDLYTENRRVYPITAIREAVRNAIHRDYSLTGKDIKVAVYDDMIEITIPGKLLPSIDYKERKLANLIFEIK